MRHFNTLYSWLRSLPALSLRTALLTAVLVPFLGITLLTGWYSSAQLEKHAVKRMQEDIELVARAIRLPLSHALERGYERTVQRALDSAFSIDRVYGAYVYGKAGELVAESGELRAPVKSKRAARLADQGQRSGNFEQAEGERVFSYFVPLTDSGGRIIGLLQVTRKGSDFDRYLGKVRFHTLAVVAIAGLTLALIVVLGHRWIVGRYLTAVQAGLSRIREGDFSHRLALRGPKELRLLATAVNRMAEAIQRSHAALAQQREREAALRERLHQSEKMAALGQLAAGVAHELGSPLSTVDGKAQRLLRRTDLPEPAIAGLGVIRRESERMTRLIRQLLDFGRANPLQRYTTPADHPLRSAVANLENPARGVSVHLQAPSQLGDICIDILRLEQALRNLIENACQAAASEVICRVMMTPGEVRYEVIDDGPGIAAEDSPRLFEPFFTTKPVGQGTGLGLAIAHAAARDHGGWLEVTTAAGGGACFTLGLPQSAEIMP